VWQLGSSDYYFSDNYAIVVTKCGFPFRALAETSENFRSVGAPPVVIFPEDIPGFIAKHIIVLPTAVLPLGFALNTLFYAAVLLGVVEGVAFARRRIRRRKGRCASCGYDRAGLAEGAACPECGGKA
jgi:hypothetical protein